MTDVLVFLRAEKGCFLPSRAAFKRGKRARLWFRLAGYCKKHWVTPLTTQNQHMTLQITAQRIFNIQA
jgi:hypothetical protein